MGALLSRGAGDQPVVPAVDIDFERVTATAAEQELYEQSNALLRRGEELLEILRNYKGSSEGIRKAISAPSEANDMEVWAQLLPSVTLLQQLFEFAQRLMQQVALLLDRLCTHHPNTTKTLQENQALAKLFGEILSFVVVFDQIKMAKPEIQNDFSFYRRSMARMKGRSVEAPVRDELANKMSLFYAYPTPMLNALIEAMTAFLAHTNGRGLGLAETLAHLSDVCLDVVGRRRYTTEDTRVFCMNLMVACAVLYDHIQPGGAFSKKSPIKMRLIIKLLGAGEDHLRNALRYTTKHLNDPATSKEIRALLGAAGDSAPPPASK